MKNTFSKFGRAPFGFMARAFRRKDVTAEKLSGEVDLILMIDVIEHISRRDRLRAAFENVKSHLAKGGVFMVAPAPEDFTRFDVGEPIPFRYSRMLAIKKP